MSARINKYFFLAVVAILIFSFYSCSKKPDRAVEQQKLLALHNAQQAAHLKKNARQFVDQFADKMVSVNQGKISTTTKDSALLRFQNYFDQVQIKEWKDIDPPVIDFSTDASMAYMVVDKLVVLTYLNEENKAVEETTHFAWVSIFKKQAGGDWKIVCNVSTNEPETRN